MAKQIESKLMAELQPRRLDIVDESHKHAGHAGWQPGGGTHFHVAVVSDAFAGESRVQRQRMVYRILAEELAGRLHALQLTTLTPDEDDARGGR